MSIEQQPTNRQEKLEDKPIFRDQREEVVMTQAYEQASKILADESIKQEQFADTYAETLLTKCATYVTNCEAMFEKNRQSQEGWMRAEIFGKTLEGLLHQQISPGVYGDDVRGVSTASYDDYYAGIDEVIERQGPDGTTYIGCALDFTFGSPKKKIANIHDSIKAGALNDVTFYESPFGDPPHIHGKLQGIPKMVVGMDASHLVDLAEEWMENSCMPLKENQLFLMILRQIEQQAEVYGILATRENQTEVAERYRQVHSAVSRLYREQKEEQDVMMLDSDITSDRVNMAIRAEMEGLV